MGHLIRISPTGQASGWQGTEKLHQVTRWCPKTPSDDSMEKKKPWENPGSVGGHSASLASFPL